MPLVPRVNVSEFRITTGHDLAEAKGHDGQVVAAQPQRGCAEKDAEDGGDRGADETASARTGCGGR